MRILPRSVLLAGAALCALAALPAQAAAKCVASTGHPVLPGYLLILDGTVVGEFEMQEQWQVPSPDEVHSVDVTCIDLPQPEAPGARQTAVIVVTRSGFDDAALRTLGKLVDAQRTHRERHGVYATTLAELGVVGLGKYLPVEMTIAPGGFAAHISGGELGLRCAVGLGTVDAGFQLTAEQARGTPGCRPLIRD